jgi:hypothetical protein
MRERQRATEIEKGQLLAGTVGFHTGTDFRETTGVRVRAAVGWHVSFLNDGPRIRYLCRMRHRSMSEDCLYLA